MRLIDADALYEKTAEWEAQALAQVERYNPTDSFEEWRRWSYVLKERSAFKFDVADAPTIDAVEVVRCCNCKWSKESSGRLFCTNGYNARAIDPYGFCEKGKR